MTFEQQWIEHDYNPFVLFSSAGKVISLNSQAQFLLGSISAQELFNLATAYANITFGFKTTFLELEFGRYKFFALTVGYESDDEIGIKLYQMPSFKLTKQKPVGEPMNIYTLVDLCISTNSINSNTVFEKEFDPTIPEIMIDSNNFIKLLNKIYACYADNERIVTSIFYRIGEHVKFDNDKYSIFSVEVSSSKIDQEKLDELKVFAKNTDFFMDFKKKIAINIPMVRA